VCDDLEARDKLEVPDVEGGDIEAEVQGRDPDYEIKD
jgi:hypothetical protein